MDKQTTKNTNFNVFCPPPPQAVCDDKPRHKWHGVTGRPHNFVFIKLFLDPMYSSAARGGEDFGENAPLTLSPLTLKTLEQISKFKNH